MTDLGEPKSFLGINIDRDRANKIINLTQEAYIEKMLNRFGFSKMYPQRTPKVTNQVASRERRDREEPDDDETLKKTASLVNFKFREAVGSLLYLANVTRPDILYAVNVLSRHQINPTENEWNMVMRVFRYLNGTKTIGLRFLGLGDEIEGYSDSSLSDCKDSITTCGYVIRLFGDTISYKTTKQSYVAISTCEAEYVAMSYACREMIAVYNSIILILDTSLMPLTLWCDNSAADKCTEKTGNNRLKHMIDTQIGYFKDCLKHGFIRSRWVPSKEQIADIFTKPLAFLLHNKLTNMILSLESYMSFRLRFIS